MDKVASLDAQDRNELFRESAARRGISSAVVEKDFWVCWVLKKIFTDAALKEHLVFKGGTSLSKVFRLIDRFSEDIDLVLDWRLIGYGPELEDPEKVLATTTQQDRLNKQINEKAATYIAEKLVNQLRGIFSQVHEMKVEVDSHDAHSVRVMYPSAFAEAYLRPEVRLEIGPLASWVPSKAYTIQPYASENFPALFDNPSCPVVAIAAERTFWEKATILHQQAHRTGTMPPRYSRHYYDLYKLALSTVKNNALADLKLLADVVAFKQRFYPSAWARYDLAQPGSFRLVPEAQHLSDLEKDYRDMKVMIFGEFPSFDTIRDVLRQLEKEINGGKAPY